jgi:hypothetical protein
MMLSFAANPGIPFNAKKTRQKRITPDLVGIITLRM